MTPCMFGHAKLEEVARRFTEPRVKFSKVKGGGDEALDAFERAIFGFTTVELRCSTCGELVFRVAAGDQR